MPKLMPTRKEVNKRIFAILECLKNCGGSFDGLMEFANHLLINLPPEYTKSNSTNSATKTHSFVTFITRRMIKLGLLKTELIGGTSGRTLRISIGNQDFSPPPITTPVPGTIKTTDAAETQGDEIDFDRLLQKIRLKRTSLADMQMILAVINEIKPYVIELEQRLRSRIAEVARLEEKNDTLSRALMEVNRRCDLWRQRYEELNKEVSPIVANSSGARVRAADVIAAPGE